MTLFSVIIVLTVSFLAAFLIIHKESAHCKALYNARNMITDIKNSALFSNYSFDKIIREMNKSGKYESFDFLKNFCIQTDDTPVPAKWKKAVETSECNLFQWERDVLVKLCDSLCCCSRNDIEEYCMNALRDIDAFMQTANERKEKNARSKAVFALSSGVMLALLLI